MHSLVMQKDWNVKGKGDAGYKDNFRGWYHRFESNAFLLQLCPGAKTTSVPTGTTRRAVASATTTAAGSATADQAVTRPRRRATAHRGGAVTPVATAAVR